MKGTTYALMATMLFGMYAIFGKVLLQSVSPFIITVLHQALAGLLLIFILDLLKKIRELKETSYREIKIIAVISVFSSVLGPILFLLGLGMTSVANSVILSRLETVFISIMAIYFLGERVTKHQLMGSITMFLGIFAIATNNFSTGLVFSPGDILIVGSSISYAIGIILFKKYLYYIRPGVIVTLRNIFGASMLFALSFMFTDFSIVIDVMTLEFVLALLGLSVLSTIAAQYLWYRALEITEASKVSMVSVMSPVSSIFFAFLFLGEFLTTAQIVGGGLVILGVFTIQFHFSRIHTPLKLRRHLKLRHVTHV